MPIKNPLSIAGGRSKETSGSEDKSTIDPQSIPRTAAGVVNESGEIIDQSGKAIGKISDSDDLQSFIGNTVTETGDILSSSGDILGKAALGDDDGSDYTTRSAPEVEKSGTGDWNILGKTKSAIKTADNLQQPISKGYDIVSNLRSQRGDEGGDADVPQSTGSDEAEQDAQQNLTSNVEDAATGEQDRSPVQMRDDDHPDVAEENDKAAQSSPRKEDGQPKDIDHGEGTGETQSSLDNQTESHKDQVVLRTEDKTPREREADKTPSEVNKQDDDLESVDKNMTEAQSSPGTTEEGLKDTEDEQLAQKSLETEDQHQELGETELSSVKQNTEQNDKSSNSLDEKTEEPQSNLENQHDESKGSEVNDDDKETRKEKDGDDLYQIPIERNKDDENETPHDVQAPTEEHAETAPAEGEEPESRLEDQDGLQDDQSPDTVDKEPEETQSGLGNQSEQDKDVMSGDDIVDKDAATKSDAGELASEEKPIDDKEDDIQVQSPKPIDDQSDTAQADSSQEPDKEVREAVEEGATSAKAGEDQQTDDIAEDLPQTDADKDQDKDDTGEVLDESTAQGKAGKDQQSEDVADDTTPGEVEENQQQTKDTGLDEVLDEDNVPADAGKDQTEDVVDVTATAEAGKDQQTDGVADDAASKKDSNDQEKEDAGEGLEESATSTDVNKDQEAEEIGQAPGEGVVPEDAMKDQETKDGESTTPADVGEDEKKSDEETPADVGESQETKNLEDGGETNEDDQEKPKVDYSILKDTKVNKAGKLVNKNGDVVGRLVEGDRKQLVGKKSDGDGNIWSDAGQIVGKGEPLPDSEQEDLDYAPFENFPDATVEADGRVMSKGRQVGEVVEGDIKRIKGSHVDEDGDILDRRGNVVGKAKPWDEPEPEPEPEEVKIDRSILAGKRVNKAGNVVDSSGTIYGRVIDGNIPTLIGRMCDKEGNILSESGDKIGKAEIVSEGEREGFREGPFAELQGCTVAKDGTVVTPSGDVVGRLVSGDPKSLFGRAVDEDGDVVDKNGNVLGKAERWEQPEEEKDNPWANCKTNREGDVLDEDGHVVGKLVSGDAMMCAGKEIDDDGDVINSKGNTIGHVALLEDIPPEPTETAEEKEEREQAAKDKKLAIQLAGCIEQALDKIRPICKMITDKIDAAEKKPKEELDEEQLVKEVKPLIEEGGKILSETNGSIRGLDPDGRIQRNAKHKAGTKEATAEEYHLADVLKELTGTVTETIDNAKRKIDGMPHAKKELSPLWGLLAEPLVQIIAAVGLLLNGVLGLVGRLLDGLGLGGIVNNLLGGLLGGLGLDKILGGLGLGGALDALTGKKKKKT